MDPCNPFNNLAEGISQDVIDIFESTAAQSLAVIRNGLVDVEDLFFENVEDEDDFNYDDSETDYDELGIPYTRSNY